jgi:hypothetical protein
MESEATIACERKIDWLARISAVVSRSTDRQKRFLAPQLRRTPRIWHTLRVGTLTTFAWGVSLRPMTFALSSPHEDCIEHGGKCRIRGVSARLVD